MNASVYHPDGRPAACTGGGEQAAAKHEAAHALALGACRSSGCCGRRQRGPWRRRGCASRGRVRAQQSATLAELPMLAVSLGSH
jgi:hypothetical protein